MTIVTETREFQVGEFAFGSWGYDQTNIDFYLVVRRTEKSIWLQPVKSQIVEQTGYLSEYVVPTSTPKKTLHREYIDMGNGHSVINNTVVDCPVEMFRIKSWNDGTEYICPKFGLIYPYDNKPKYASHTH